MARTKHGLPGIYNATPITLSDEQGSALAVNASGQLIAAAPSGSSSNQVQGTAADNAAAVGNPVRVGGKYNSGVQTYADGDIADFQMDSQGRVKTTDAPRDYLVDDITVYGTNTEQGSLTAGSLNADLMPSTDVSVYKTGVIQVAGTWSGTLTVQGANDNSNWNTITVFNPGSLTSPPASSITGNGHYVFAIAHKFIRIRMTSYSSGTATGTLELETLPFSPTNIIVGSSSATGATVPSNAFYHGLNARGTSPSAVTSGQLVGATADLLGVQHVANGGLVTTAVAAGTAGNTVIKASAGRLCRVLVTTAGTAAMLIYDNATTNSGTVIGAIPANAVAGSLYDFQMPAANGITVDGDGNNPAVTIGWI